MESGTRSAGSFCAARRDGEANLGNLGEIHPQNWRSWRSSDTSIRICWLRLLVDEEGLRSRWTRLQRRLRMMMRGARMRVAMATAIATVQVKVQVKARTATIVKRTSNRCHVNCQSVCVYLLLLYFLEAIGHYGQRLC